MCSILFSMVITSNPTVVLAKTIIIDDGVEVDNRIVITDPSDPVWDKLIDDGYNGEVVIDARTIQWWYADYALGPFKDGARVFINDPYDPSDKYTYSHDNIPKWLRVFTEDQYSKYMNGTNDEKSNIANTVLWQGSDKTHNCDLYFTKNGRYIVMRRCVEYTKSGNVKGEVIDAIVIDINAIDSLSPIVSVKSVDEEYSKDSTHITFKAEDPSDDSSISSSTDEIDFQWSKDNTNWVTSSTFEYLANYTKGVQKVYCKDKAGNVTEFSDFSVDKIDKWAPTQSSIEVKLPDGYSLVKTDNGEFTNAPYAELVITSKDNQKYIKTSGGTQEDTDTQGSGLDHIDLYGSPTSFEKQTISGSKIRMEENGRYSYKLVDAIGNTSNELYYDAKIFDRYAPSLLASEHLGEDSAYIKVEASDDQAGLHAQPFSFDGGKTWTSNDTFNVTENGPYTLAARDVLGNTQTYQFTVTIVDKEPPRVTHVESDWGKTVTVSFELSDNNTINTAKELFSYDNGNTWTSLSSNEYERNGMYTIVAKDRFGNKVEYKFEVTHVDSTQPTLICTYEKSATNDDVIVTVNASDTQSGLADNYIKYNDDPNWTSEKTYTVKQNGSLKVSVRDKAGNINEMTIKIDSIDKEAPAITAIEYSPAQSKQAEKYTVTIKAEDKGTAGLADKWLSWDNGKNWTAKSSKEFTENGKYSFQVRDIVGNTTKGTVEIKNIYVEPVPEVKPTQPSGSDNNSDTGNSGSSGSGSSGSGNSSGSGSGNSSSSGSSGNGSSSSSSGSSSSGNSGSSSGSGNSSGTGSSTGSQSGSVAGNTDGKSETGTKSTSDTSTNETSTPSTITDLEKGESVSEPGKQTESTDSNIVTEDLTEKFPEELEKDVVLAVSTTSGHIEVNKNDINKFIKRYNMQPDYVAEYKGMTVVGINDTVYDVVTGEEIKPIDLSSLKNKTDISEIDLEEVIQQADNVISDEELFADMQPVTGEEPKKSNIGKIVIPIVATTGAVAICGGVGFLVWRKKKS